jgi:hypothetical protein
MPNCVNYIAKQTQIFNSTQQLQFGLICHGCLNFSWMFSLNYLINSTMQKLHLNSQCLYIMHKYANIILKIFQKILKYIFVISGNLKYKKMLKQSFTFIILDVLFVNMLYIKLYPITGMYRYLNTIQCFICNQI